MTLRWFGGKALALEVKARGEEPLRLFIHPEERTTRQRAGVPQSRAWVAQKADAVPEGTFLIDGPGEYEVTPFAVKVIALASARQQEQKILATVVAADDCTVAYLDVASALALKPEYVEAIGDVTILVIAFPDSAKAADRERAVKALGAVSTIEPKVFIPLASESLLPHILGELGAKGKEAAASFVCRSASLPEEGMEVAVLATS